MDTCDRFVGSHPWLVSLVARRATGPLFAVRASPRHNRVLRLLAQQGAVRDRHSISHKALSREARVRVRIVLMDQLRGRAEVEDVVEVSRWPKAHRPGYLS